MAARTVSTTTSTTPGLTPLFQWLLNRPPIIRQKRTHIILCPDPNHFHLDFIHEHCKIQLSYGLYELKNRGRFCGTSTLVYTPAGRHRFSFKRVDYPRHSSCYALTPNLPPTLDLKQTDVYDLWMSIFHTFEKQNWRTEEGTRRGVEELERKFGSGFRFGSGFGSGGGGGNGNGEGGDGKDGGDGGGGPLLVESNGEISERVGRFSFAIE